MLDALRRIGRTWIGKIVGIFLIIGLAGFGISNVIFDFGSNVVARVGSEDITTQEFARVYQQELNRVAGQLGYQPTPQQALAMGIPSGVLISLTSEAAIAQATGKLGLGVSDEKLRSIVQSNQDFFGMLGRFDRDLFNRALSASGYTEAEYLELERRQARRDQFETGLLGGTTTSQTALNLLQHYQNDKRTIEYFILNAGNIDPPAAVTDEELTAYLSAHQVDYRTKETRTAEILVLTPDSLAAKKTPTEDEIRAEYERTKDQLTKLERRQIQQVSLPDETKAQFFEAQKAAGVKFAEALTASGLAATDLGLLAKSEVTDPNLAEAAFGLPGVGDFAIIAGIGAKRVVAVTAIEPGGTVSYEDAKADIAKKLAVDAAKAEYADIQDQIEELRAAFRPLKEISERYGLPLVNVTLTAEGDALSAVAGVTEENRPRLANAIFAAEQGKLSAALTLGGTNNIYYELAKVEPARDQTLEEVRPAVTEAITNEQTKAALEAEAKKVVAELDAGTSFGVLASQYNQTAIVSAPIGRSGDPTPELNAQVAAAVFSGGPSAHGSAINGNGDTVIYHVTAVVPAEGAPDERTKTLIENATRQALYAELIASFRQDLPFSVNQQALNSVLALDTAQ
ncbi:MAG: SurA N-terminal domain-containing protein [Devosia sp.]